MPVDVERPSVGGLGTDFSFLASRAAIELDKMLHRAVDVSETAIHDLAGRLQGALKKCGEPQALPDPAFLMLLGDAMPFGPTGGAIHTTDELIHEANQAACGLATDPNFATDDAKLKWFRDFCVALSRGAVAYRKSISDMKPTHPFRR